MHGDAAAGAITGGIVSERGFCTSGTGIVQTLAVAQIQSGFPLALDSVGNNPIALSVVCTSFSGTANVVASINWHETQ